MALQWSIWETNHLLPTSTWSGTEQHPETSPLRRESLPKSRDCQHHLQQVFYYRNTEWRWWHFKWFLKCVSYGNCLSLRRAEAVWPCVKFQYLWDMQKLSYLKQYHFKNNLKTWVKAFSQAQRAVRLSEEFLLLFVATHHLYLYQHSTERICTVQICSSYEHSHLTKNSDQTPEIKHLRVNPPPSPVFINLCGFWSYS